MENNKVMYSISENEEIFEIVITGKVKSGYIEKITDEVIAIKKEANLKKLLVDIRTIEGRFGYAESYFSVKKYSSSFHGIHIALVDIPEDAAWESFHERTAVSAGVSFRWFTDIDNARAWLKSK
ncbi:MAG: hypothetical protein JW976_09650 [Syntrophaceae bacterium]|nr:hypothetical protein [Syntrophaceae bacterium]